MNDLFLNGNIYSEKELGFILSSQFYPYPFLDQSHNLVHAYKRQREQENKREQENASFT